MARPFTEGKAALGQHSSSAAAAFPLQLPAGKGTDPCALLFLKHNPLSIPWDHHSLIEIPNLVPQLGGPSSATL